MKPVVKIISGFTITFIIVIVLNYFINNNLIILTGMLAIVISLFYILYGAKTFWKLAKFWLKFAVFLIGVFVLFGIFENGIQESFLLESLLNGTKTALVLLNTVYILEMFILSITINDILSINLPIDYLKFLILMRTLMNQVLAKFDNDKILFNIIPEFQSTKGSKIKNIKPLFLKNLIHIMTLTFFIKEQGDILGPMIDNRIIHIHKTNSNEK
jgi:hypothetical protein